MSRIAIPNFDDSPEDSKLTLEAIKKKIGALPNLFRLVGNSPKALKAYTGFEAETSKMLDAKTRERIALAVAQVNRCSYCLSAHTYIGLNIVKLSPEEIALNRKGQSSDAKANAGVAFAYKVAQERGHVGDSDISTVRQAGYTDTEIVELVALVVLNSFTNFLNEVAETEIDFPIIDIDGIV